MMTWWRENWRLYRIRCEIWSEINGIVNVTSFWVSSWHRGLLVPYLSLINKIFLVAKTVRLVMHSRLSFEGRNKDNLLYRHFFGPRHHGLEDVSIQLIDRASGEESALRDKEGQWAYRLNCIFTVRIGRLDLASGKSTRVFIFICSACKFSNFSCYNGVWCL